MVVFVAAIVGQLLASGAGRGDPSRLTWRPATVIDSIGGAAVNVIVGPADRLADRLGWWRTRPSR